MIAIFSDIHGNHDALSSVLEDIQRHEVSDIWCLGDIVGYGAEPSQCIETVRETCSRVVTGNHDRLAVGQEPLSFLSEHVSSGILYARENLTKDQTEWLKALPYGFQNENASVVHASLCHPEEFSYLSTDMEARLHFQSQPTPISFVGHTHVPLITVEDGSSIEWKDLRENVVIHLDKNKKCSINVGSVGQPRDENPYACYVLFDNYKNTIQMKRVAYDILSAQKKIAEARLPQVNAARLSVGR